MKPAALVTYDGLMASPGVIVLERTGRWGACAREAVGGLPAKCRSVRRASQCLADAGQAPGSVVLIDGDDLDDLPLVDLVQRLAQRDCQAFVVLLLDDVSPAAECLLREAGAGQIFHEMPSAAELADILRRHFARRGDLGQSRPGATPDLAGTAQ